MYFIPLENMYFKMLFAELCYSFVTFSVYCINKLYKFSLHMLLQIFFCGRSKFLEISEAKYKGWLQG